jgi:hypothetical protein
MKKLILPLILLLSFPNLDCAWADSSSGPNWWTRNANCINTLTGIGNVGIGTVLPGTTLDVQGTTRSTNFVNTWSLVSTATPSAVSSFTISGLTAGVKYALFYKLTQNTAIGSHNITFNADSGANYTWSSTYSFNGGGPTATSGASAAFINLTGFGTVFTAGNAQGIVYISPSAASNNTELVNFQNENQNSAVIYVNTTGGGVYLGAAGLTSLTFTTTGGTITGTANLYAIQ